MREITIIQAQNEAIIEEMERDSTIFIIGENVRSFGTEAIYSGLLQKFGEERVRDTAISETAILGGAIGAAATGMRPIAALGFVDFMGVCGDELINQLQMRYMFGGKVKLPLTITVAFGAGRSLAHQHSKSSFGWFMSAKGLKIVSPSTSYDAKGLLKSAIREDNPVLFMVHKLLGTLKSPVPDKEYTIPLGKADIKREGKDVTVVTVGGMVPQALAAANKLQERGISLEVIDLRTIVPLDKQAILDSVKKTGKLVVLIEEPKTAGIAAEVSAIVAEEGLYFLNAPIKRVCAPDTPIPFSPVLENFWIPQEEDLIKAVTEIT